MSRDTLDLGRYQIKEVVNQIKDYIEANDMREDLHFTKETLKRMEVAARLLDVAADAMDDVDMLLSADFGEESFKKSFDEDNTIFKRVNNIIRIINKEE